MKSKEITDLERIIEKVKISRSPEKRQYRMVKARLYAAKLLAKRHLNIKELITEELVKECLSVIGDINTTAIQKMAARVTLDIKFGFAKTNKLIEKIWVGAIANRGDRLVKIWRNKVLERDGYKCAECGSKENLTAHHISPWHIDPLNRINVDNGITLCGDCHNAEHPEYYQLTMA